MNQMSPLLVFASYGVVLFLAMYFFIYIPNKKKQKKMQSLHDSLKPGDQVVTVGGIVANVVRRDGNYVTLLVDEENNVTMKVVIYAINQVLKEETGA